MASIRRLLGFEAFFLVVRFFLILLLSAQVQAQVNLHAVKQVPTGLSGVKLVSSAEARLLLGKAVFVDTRILHDYLAGHLPDALHVPYKEASLRRPDFDPAQDDVPAFLARLSKFVPDSGSQLVFYCNGTSCWKSYKAAKAAFEAGYSQVLWLREGMAVWQAQGFELVQE